MAIAFDASTRFPVTDDTRDTTSGDRTFTHTPVGTPVGVCVMIQNNTNAAIVSGVLYGGVAMTQTVVATDTSELGRVEIWTLIASIPTGAQTVTLQGCVGNQWAVCATVTSATGFAAINTSGNTDTGTSTSQVHTLTTTLTTMSFGGVHSGVAAPGSMTPATGCTRFGNGFDYGSSSSAMCRRTNVDAAGSVSVGFTVGASEDFCVGAVAFAEASPPASAFVGKVAFIG